MGGYGEDHAHLERLAISVELRGDRLQRGGRDRMQDLAVRAFGQARLDHAPDLVRQGDRVAVRSEEHTSELQSLMRISYAVFCLKKKTTIYIHRCDRKSR